MVRSLGIVTGAGATGSLCCSESALTVEYPGTNFSCRLHGKYRVQAGECTTKPIFRMSIFTRPFGLRRVFPGLILNRIRFSTGLYNRAAPSEYRRWNRACGSTRRGFFQYCSFPPGAGRELFQEISECRRELRSIFSFNEFWKSFTVLVIRLTKS